MRSHCIKSKGGSYIAEAAVVLPIIIFALITTILIIMFFYECSVEKSKMHIALRCQAGHITGKTVYYHDNLPCEVNDIWNGEVSITRRGMYSIVKGKENVSMVHSGLLEIPAREDIYGEWHAVDPSLIRRMK